MGENRDEFDTLKTQFTKRRSQPSGRGEGGASTDLYYVRYLAHCRASLPTVADAGNSSGVLDGNMRDGKALSARRSGRLGPSLVVVGKLADLYSRVTPWSPSPPHPFDTVIATVGWRAGGRRDGVVPGGTPTTRTGLGHSDEPPG